MPKDQGTAPGRPWSSVGPRHILYLDEKEKTMPRGSSELGHSALSQ